ncbi:hypothetical protein [Halalkalibacter sp. APA_J-10(15)]|uniref:hypothetical protein n=1 Tax=Halalkalibacter sp. APA_J-10(15) TaxID=2933805 RepID=UPI001FF3046B|nr:hypothetical protein [Halalkalibacter sp. APA_J-10(15)]MCK0471418.1 hypothetical protein [Halalkalibacter sp. APA_J-10(15)]
MNILREGIEAKRKELVEHLVSTGKHEKCEISHLTLTELQNLTRNISRRNDHELV